MHRKPAIGSQRADYSSYPHYKSVLRCRPPCSSVRTPAYFDGGDLTPYAIESLIELVRAEARLAHAAIEVVVEVNGGSTVGFSRELASRFAALGLTQLSVRIETEGQATIVVGSTGARSLDDSSLPRPTRHG